MRSGLWWALTVGLLPLVLPMAIYTRATARRLPEAAGAKEGLAGKSFSGEAFVLVLIGESTVAGVGVASHEQALSGQLAEQLAQRLRRPVQWRAVGENGITAGQSCERLLAEATAQPADLLLVVLGVNDTTHLTSIANWQAALRRIAQAGLQSGAQVAYCAVPPLEHFRALPWLLRRLLGWRARLLDQAMRGVAATCAAQHCALTLSFEADFLAEDGYHPSAKGYRLWAQGLVQQLRLTAAE